MSNKLALLLLSAAVLPGQSRAATQSQALARIMAGGGWETSIVLLNMSSNPLAFSQAFLAQDGTPRQFGVRSQADGTVLTTSGVQATLNPNSSLTFVLFDNGSPVREGWSVLSYDTGQGKLGGYAVLRHRALGGSFSFETTVPLSNMQEYSVHVPFDNTQGFRTQLTLVNPASNIAAQVALTYTSPQGQVVLMDLVSLQPGQQMTISLPDTYPDLANTAGTIAVEGNINRLSVLGLRYNDSYGAVATVPVIN